MPYAGYVARISILGGSTATVFTAEAMTGAGAGPYTITNTSRSIWSPTNALTFYNNGVPISAGDLLSVDLLFGKVTFTGAKAGPITVDGRYRVMFEIPYASECSFEFSRDMLDTTAFLDTVKKRIAGLVEASGSIHVKDELSVDIDTGAGTRKLFDTLEVGDSIVLGLSPTSSAPAKYRMYALLTSVSTEVAVDGLLESDIEFVSVALTSIGNWPISLSYFDV